MAAVAGAATRWLCRRRPHFAYLLGLIVLVKCWMPPLWTSYGGIFCWPPTTTVTRGAPPVAPPQTATFDHSPAMPVSWTVQRSGETRKEPPRLAPYHRPSATAEIAPRAKLMIAAFAVWMVGVVGFLVRAYVESRRWRNRIRPLPRSDTAGIELVAANVAGQLGLLSRPAVIVTSNAAGPALFGLIRPTIVIPHHLLAGPGKKALPMVLAHEMVHLRRGDLYVGLFQFATQAVWWFHPLVWWVSRQVTRERERLCDEAVLAALKCPAGDYAQCLLDVLRLKRQPPLLPALAGMGVIDATDERLEHIMQPSLAPRSRTPRVYWLLAVLALWLVLPGGRLNFVVADGPTPAGPPEQTGTPPVQRSRSKPSEKTPTPADADPSQQLIDAAAKPGAATAAADNADKPSASEQAIDRGVRFLLSKQRDNGSWPDPVGYPGGITALSTLALLKDGVNTNDPAIQKALDFLKRIHPSMTYSTALQTLVFCAADPQVYEERIKRNVEWLADKQKEQWQFKGAWGYPQAEGDNSNTGFAVWALFEADRVGIEVENIVWRRSLEYFLSIQNADGSWGYKPSIAGTGSMTSQGLYCVAAAAKVLREDRPDQPAAQSIERATGWLTSNVDVDGNPGSRGARGYKFYYRLALAKAGQISEQSKFGDHDWFAEGLKSLLDSQQSDGSWFGTGHAEDDPHLATSMAILFLVSGRGR